MTKILAFAGSSSPTSINHQLILNVTRRISDHQVEVLELNKLDIPLYSIVKEKEGFPENVKFIYKKIVEAPALIIAVNEYNSNVSGFFKNIIDWLSRVEKNFLGGKKILLMSTSPGKRGGASALEYCKNQFPRFGGEVVESFSLPQFYENFDSEKGVVVNEIFDLGIIDVITSFSQNIKEAAE
ncbi:NAD(P)H-dependent oxidoreductase [Salinimicrobium sp. MT39]|uniref:NAD(P)H-dependent oxidoreductase n=1 Tax=Salinimicrobium profundisediminis TaxID=2994553 RepID=A0A9X3I0N6_9FLAO|nr:NADPH-dependent FMN reductase [Salinimicrobium profundisediminis]MCX2837739.1 NAD(P)H-dependent oxidoreductase [Salinimicrobium profundisediminis]